MIPTTCHRCPEPTTASLGIRTYCRRHYRAIVEPIRRRLAYNGTDALTGTDDHEAVDLSVPVGWMEFDRPAPAWPAGYVMLRCDVCGYEAVGCRPTLCDRCTDRGRS